MMSRARMRAGVLVTMMAGWVLAACGPETDASGETEEVASLPLALTHACGATCCDVREFGAVANDGQNDRPAIQAAITAALQTSHRHVYIPQGTWDIASAIDMTSGQPSRVTISGQHSKGTKLRWMNNLDYHIFNTSGNYSYFKVELRNLTIDGSHLPYTSGTGHGVRVGGGWDTGYLHLENLNIVHSGFYGVGVQNNDATDKPVRELWLRNSYVAKTGSDGIDLKSPPNADNTDVHINNVVFSDVGQSVLALGGTNSDAAIDMTADGFGIYRVTIVTPAHVTHSTGTNVVTGVRLRRRGDSWNDPAARNGSINRLYVKYADRGVFFEGWNRGVTVERTTIRDVARDGIYLRGKDNVIKSTICAINIDPPYGRLKINSDKGGASMQNNDVVTPSLSCLPTTEVGATSTDRDSSNRIDVDETMNCD